jgi:hypothetical protein
MGLAQTGKTTIIKVSAEGYIPQKKAPYTATIEYNRKSYEIFGKKISLFDLGGQKSFLDRFVGDLAEFIFSNVAAFIYVIDIVKVSELSLAKYYLELGIKILNKYSPNTSIAILFHKIDLIDQQKKQEFIGSLKTFLGLESMKDVTCYETSVFNQSILNSMEEIISGIKTEPSSLKEIILNFHTKHSDRIVNLHLLDENGNSIPEPHDNFSDYYQKTRNSLDLSAKLIDSNEKVKYSFIQLQSNLIFNSVLVNNYLLSIVYSGKQLGDISELYLSLLKKSINLVEELNNFTINYLK